MLTEHVQVFCPTLATPNDQELLVAAYEKYSDCLKLAFLNTLKFLCHFFLFPV